MGYYLKLSLRYIKKNKARTAYTMLGIVLTFIMCFAIMTAFYSYWDYDYYEYYRMYPFELSFWIKDEKGADAKDIKQLKDMEKDPEIEKLTIHTGTDGTRLVLPSQLKAGEKYRVWIKLNNTKNLKASAGKLHQKYGYNIQIRQDVAVYLRQDDSGGTALLNAFIALAVMIFGGFFVAILRNTMMIAVTERTRDHGLLRCVGMSEGQLRMLLFTEGILISLTGSVIGMGLGFWGMKLLEPWIVNTLGLSEVFSFNLYPHVVIKTTLLCVGVTIFSLIEPSRQSASVTPLDALHGIYSNMQKRKKKKPVSGGLEEKIFGAAGFYAKRNFKRGRGHQAAVFTALFFSIAFLLTVISYCDSLTATLKKEMKLDRASEYAEQLQYHSRSEKNSVYDRYDAGAIDDALDKLSYYEDISDTQIYMSNYQSLPYYSMLRPDPEIKRLSSEKIFDSAYQTAYDDEGLLKEQKYLMEGGIDPERMKAGNGILISDTGTDGNRKTAYKPGDTITALSPEGAGKALREFKQALIPVADKHDMALWFDESGNPVYVVDGKETVEKTQPGQKLKVLFSMTKEGVDDTGFTVILDEVLDALKKNGIDLSDRIDEDCIRIQEVLYALQDMAYEEGLTETYTIYGILSDDITTDRVVYGDRYLRIVYPIDTVLKLIERVRAEEEKTGTAMPEEGLYNGFAQSVAYGMGFTTSIAIKRNAEFLNPEIQKLASKLNYWQYINWYGSDDYFELSQMLKVAQLVVILLGSFIITVCLIQIINTLQANMRLRRKELWLYDVVGMDPKDRFKMQLVEHGFSAILALIFGMIASFLASWVFIKKLLDWSGDGYVYKWPWSLALILTVAISAVIFTVNFLEIRRSQNRP